LDSIGNLCCAGEGDEDVDLPIRATIQGGYISYETLARAGINPAIKIDKFIGQETVPTFNLNGNRKAGQAFLRSPIFEKRFISKNVCHTVVYDKKVHEFVMGYESKSRAGELLREGMDLYLQRHPEGKKFHDPTAAVGHMHAEIGQWVDGQLFYEKGKWGTTLMGPPNCKILGTLDYNQLWEHIALGN
jgi:pyrimidine-specific ribonucleoside hydrolase